SKEGNVVGAFDLGGRPELVGTDAKGNVFANLVQKNVVLQIDSRKMTAGQTWPVAPGVGPRTMAVDQRNGRLFIGCANRRMVILDSNNGRVIGSLPIGPGRQEIEIARIAVAADRTDVIGLLPLSADDQRWSLNPNPSPGQPTGAWEVGNFQPENWVWFDNS